MDSRRSIWMARKICRIFVAEAAAFARLDQPRQLHRQRRAAGDDAAIAGELPCRAGKRQHVDAVMVPEALVLIGDQHLDELRVDLVEADGEPPAPVGRGKGAQQLRRRGRSTSVETGDLFGQRRRKGAVEADQPADRERRQRRAACAQRRPPCAVFSSSGASALSCRSRRPHGALTSIMPGRGAGRDIAAGTCPRRRPPGGHRRPASPRAPHRPA